MFLQKGVPVKKARTFIILSALLTFVFLFVLSSYLCLFQDRYLFLREYKKHPYEVTYNLHMEEIVTLQAAMMNYFIGQRPRVDNLKIMKDGQPVHLFSDKMVQHLTHIRTIFFVAIALGLISLLLAYFLNHKAKTLEDDRKEISKWYFHTYLGLTVFLVLCGILISLNFNGFFHGLQFVLFGGHIPSFDPAKEYILNWMPLSFYRDVTTAILGLHLFFLTIFLIVMAVRTYGSPAFLEKFHFFKKKNAKVKK